MLNIAINGFGRIGRNFLRVALEHSDKLKVVAINDLAPLETSAHLLSYDSTYGRLAADVSVSDEKLYVNGKAIAYSQHRALGELPWKALEVDVVIEATGLFTERAAAQAHLEAGAKKVIISAPGSAVDLTVVLGVNEELYDKSKHHIVSNASCTTNCLAPIASLLHKHYGIVSGYMVTTHAYTNDQRLMDSSHSDLRRARAAAVNVIPTGTGAAKALGEVIPELSGKLDGHALRVPIPTGSLISFTFNAEKEVSVSALNALVQAEAAKPALASILDYSEAPLVSSDIVGNSHSAIFDAGLTKVDASGKLVTVTVWYDNEWGYTNRLIELSAMLLA